MDSVGKDKLDIMIQLAGQSLIENNLEVGVTDETADAAFPKRLYRKIIRMIRHESGRPMYNDFTYQVCRVAVVILTTCSLCFAMAMSVEAVRVALWDAVVEWFEDYIAVIFVPEVEPPSVIEEYHEPQLVSVGCERRVGKNTHGMYSITYYLDNKKVLKYYQFVFDEADLLYDNKTKALIPKAINGHDAFIINYFNENILTWNDGYYIYELISYDEGITVEKMRMIAESVS